MAKRHVRQSEAHATRQREIIAGLRDRGHNITRAENLLHVLEASLAQHRARGRHASCFRKSGTAMALAPL